MGHIKYSAVVIAVLIKFIVHRHFQVSDMKWGELMEQTWKTGNRKWHGPEMQVIRADVEIKWHGPEMQVIRADLERKWHGLEMQVTRAVMERKMAWP